MKKCMPRKKNAKQLVNNLEKFLLWHPDEVRKYAKLDERITRLLIRKKLDCQLFTFVYPNEYLALKI